MIILYFLLLLIIIIIICFWPANKIDRKSHGDTVACDIMDDVMWKPKYVSHTTFNARPEVIAL